MSPDCCGCAADEEREDAGEVRTQRGRTLVLCEGRAAAAASSLGDFRGWQQGSGAWVWNNYCRCLRGILEEWLSNQAMFARWH